MNEGDLESKYDFFLGENWKIQNLQIVKHKIRIFESYELNIVRHSKKCIRNTKRQVLSSRFEMPFLTRLIAHTYYCYVDENVGID